MNNPVSYEDYLNTYGCLTYSNVGTSMLPLLRQGKDLFTVVRKGDWRCKAGDVVLYRRPPGHYVLHRIVKVREHDYVILGDNCVNREYGVTDDDIIGVMTRFVRKGRMHNINELGYKCYARIWICLAGLRIALKRGAYGASKWLSRR